MSCTHLDPSYYQNPPFKVLKGGLKVNTDKRLFEGKVASTYTPDWKNIKDSEYGGISDKGGVAKNIVLVVGIFFEKEKAIILIDNPI